MTDTEIQPRDFRAQGVLCAIRLCSTVVSDLLALHPRREALRKQAEGDVPTSLRALLWDELGAMEKASLGAHPNIHLDPAQGSPAEFSQRRRRAGELREMREIELELPPIWVKLLEMPAKPAHEIAMDLGIEMIIIAAGGKPMPKIVGWLGALGGDLAAKVFDQLRKSPAPKTESPTAKRWSDAYARAARQVEGPRIPTVLGQSLLAALFRRLPEDQRQMASRISRSNLPALLAENVFLEPMTDDDAAMGQKIAAKALSGMGVPPMVA